MSKLKVSVGLLSALVAVSAGAAQNWVYDPEAKTLSDGDWVFAAESNWTREGVTGIRAKSVTTIGAGKDLDFTGFEDATYGKLIEFGGGPDGMFKNTAITSVTAPDVIWIGGYIFAACKQMTNATFSANLGEIGGNSFTGCYLLDDFFPARALKLTKLGQSALQNCPLRNVDEFYFPALTNVGNQCFWATKSECSSLSGRGPRSLIATNLVKVGQFAFSGTASYCHIDGHFPNLTSVGDYSFSGAGLTEFIAPKLRNVAERALFELTSLTNVVLSDELESLGAAALYNCGHITSLSPALLPDTVTSVGNSALERTSPQKSIVIRAPAITQLPQSFHAFCHLDTNIVVGAQITSIGDYAFARSERSSIADVWFEGPMPEMAITAFYDSSENTPGKMSKSRFRFHASRGAHNERWAAWEQCLLPLTDEDRARSDFPGPKCKGKIAFSNSTDVAKMTQGSYAYVIPWRYPKTGLSIIIR